MPPTRTETITESSTRLIQIGMHAGVSGGVDRYFDGLMRACAERNLNSVGFVFGDGTFPIPSNCQYLGKQSESFSKRKRRLVKCVTDAVSEQPNVPTIIVSHFALYTFPLLKLLHSRPNLKLICQFHGPWAEESRAEGESWWRVFPKRWVESRVYRSASRIITVSKAFADLVTEQFDIPKDRVEAVPAGMVAGPFFEASKMSKSLARDRLGWPTDRKILFCVRRLARRMGIERLISAMPMILSQHPDVLLIIGGRGPIQHELKRQVAEQKLEKCVQFAGFIPEEELPIAYRASDISIVPSIALEGFGLVATESLASGTPVLVSPVGGLPEVVKPLNAALVLTDSSVSAIAAGVNRYFEQSTVGFETDDCVSYVRNRFTWDVVLPQLLSAYARA